MYIHCKLCFSVFLQKIDIYDARRAGGNIQTLLDITAEGTQVQYTCVGRKIVLTRCMKGF